MSLLKFNVVISDRKLLHRAECFWSQVTKSIVRIVVEFKNNGRANLQEEPANRSNGAYRHKQMHARPGNTNKMIFVKTLLLLEKGF